MAAIDPGYATYADPRLQPPALDERDDLECFERCAHASACEALYRRWLDGREYAGWVDDMVRRLGCERCAEFEEESE